MKTTRGQRLLQYREDLKVMIWDHIQSLSTSWYTHDHFHLDLDTIWSHTKYKRLTQCDRSWLRGYFEATYRQQIWHTKLEWRVFKDGKWWTKAETQVPGFLYEGCVQDMGAHFWAGTDYIYTVPNAIRAAYGVDTTTPGLSPLVPKRLHKVEALNRFTEFTI